MRGLLYAGTPRGRVDERALHALRRIRLAKDAPKMTLTEFKSLAREQFYMLLLDEEATMKAIPDMLPSDATRREKAFSVIKEVLEASEPITGETAERLIRVRQLFGLAVPKEARDSKPVLAGEAMAAKPKRPRTLKKANRVSGNGRHARDDYSGERQPGELTPRKI
jgi:hypothetical protein